MSRRKGELSSAGIDRRWPHQVALPASASQGTARSQELHAFADQLSVCSRGHSFVRNDEWYNVYCFSERADAEKFLHRFQGEWFDPATRGNGSRWHLLREPK
jgi:hypothetical protein